MFPSIFSRRTLRIVTHLLLPLLLFAQGLQLCLHAHGNEVHKADHAHVSAVHLESTLITAGDHEESTTDIDVTLSALIKAFYTTLAFVILSVLMLHIPLRPRRSGHPWSSDVGSLAHDYFHPTPPLRAPPR